jgi:hypothetical protein
MASQIKCNITIKQPDSIEDNLIEHKIMKQNIMKTLNLNIPFFLFCKIFETFVRHAMCYPN